ncbi:MAG: hypothetical protein AB7V32_09280 [Candidatus Berkiella sp.]
MSASIKNEMLFQFKAALEGLKKPLKEVNDSTSILEALKRAKQHGGKPSKPRHTDRVHKDTHWDHSQSKTPSKKTVSV